jgi:hypothetical protein
MKLLSCLLLALPPLRLQAFTPTPTRSFGTTVLSMAASSTSDDSSTATLSFLANNNDNANASLSRRTWIQQSVSLLGGAAALITSAPARAAVRAPLPDLLYTILRVREATEQESRLIKSGQFKDLQRANVKLAVRFMVENYRLADAVVGASAYLEGNERRIAAGEVGQAAVQNLVTILEYFDSGDVQNLKVGKMGDGNMGSGKETLVLKGLDASRRNIDGFLTYFSAADIDQAKSKIAAENKLNVEEFDPSLGALSNLPPPAGKV